MFKTRVKQSYAAFRLAFIGMIEAIILEQLVTSIPELPYLFSGTAVSITAWAQVATNIVTVFFVTSAVVTDATIERVPRPFDFIAIFTTGALQIVSVMLLGEEQIELWCWMTAAAWILSITSAYSIINSGTRDNETIPALLRWPIKQITASFIGMAILTLAAGIIVKFTQNYAWAGLCIAGALFLNALNCRAIFLWWYSEIDSND